MIKQSSVSFISTIFSIVKDAVALKDKHTAENGVPVNYACIFAQSEVEYQEMDKVAAGMGRVVKGTKMGHVYLLEQAIETVAGPLRIVKVRKPDPARKERGDADFTIRDYPAFKEKYLGQSGFKLIEKSDMEMIELADPEFKVLAYFSYPILSKVLGL